MMAALSALPYQVSQPPGGAENETYVTFNEASGAPAEHASNAPTRTKHLVQLHAFSHREDGAHRRAFFAALTLLERRAHGYRAGDRTTMRRTQASTTWRQPSPCG